MFNDYDDLLTVDETCEALRMGRDAVYKLLKTNQLKGFRNGRVWRIPKQAVIEYIMQSSNLTPNR